MCQRSAISVLVSVATLIVAGTFLTARAVGQKTPEASSLSPKVSSAGPDVKAQSPAQPDQDEVLPGSGPHSQSAPFYTVGEGFMTMLMLNNGTKAGFFVKVTLYSLDGQPAELPAIHLTAHQTKEVDLNEWATGLGPQYTTGSLRLDYRHTICVGSHGHDGQRAPKHRG